jgi:hypothetical protein
VPTYSYLPVLSDAATYDLLRTHPAACHGQPATVTGSQLNATLHLRLYILKHAYAATYTMGSFSGGIMPLLRTQP